MMAYPDPAASRAVLIGVDTFTDLPPLPSVANNLKRMQALLCHPDGWGLPEAHCVVIGNPASPEQTLDRVEEAAAQASDTLLLYYAGHGLIEPNSYNLHLALPEAHLGRLRKAVRYDDLRRLIVSATHCPAKLVILDCCYSGMAMAGSMAGGTELAEHTRIDGTCLMTASAETALALAPPDEEFTAFTGELIHVLEHGIPDGPQALDTESVFLTVRNALAAKGRPIPQQRSRNMGQAILLGRNRFGTERSESRREHAPPPRPPAGLEHTLRLRPRDLVAFIAASDPITSTAVLEASGALRSGEEVAAILTVLPHAGLTPVSAGVARRDPAGVVEVLDALVQIGHTTPIPALLREIAEQPHVAAVALELCRADLAAEFVDELLEQATLRRVESAEQVIDLAGALWARGLRHRGEAALGRVGGRISPESAARVADALRQAGREEAAFALYAYATPILLTRPIGQLAELIAAMDRAEQAGQASALLEQVAQLRGTPEEIAELHKALGIAGAAERASTLLGLASSLLADGDVFDLNVLLRERGQAEAAQQLLARAALRQPAQTTVALLVSLRDSGWPFAAIKLLDAIGDHCPGDFAVELLERQDALRVIDRLAADPKRLAALASRPTAAALLDAAPLSIAQITAALAYLLPGDTAAALLRRSLVRCLESASAREFAKVLRTAGRHRGALFVECLLSSGGDARADVNPPPAAELIDPVAGLDSIQIRLLCERLSPAYVGVLAEEGGKRLEPNGFARLAAALKGERLDAACAGFVAHHLPVQIDQALETLATLDPQAVGQLLTAASHVLGVSALVELVRLRRAAHPKDQAILLGTKLLDPQLALSHPIAAVAVLVAERCLGPHADRLHRMWSNPPAIRLAPGEEILAVWDYRLLAQQAYYLVFTTHGIVHIARRTQKAVGYERLGGVRFALTRPGAIAIFADRRVESVWMLDAEASIEVIWLLKEVQKAVQDAMADNGIPGAPTL